ncbi:MAG TPA: hypothetical protein VK009_18980 [Chloroflexota bacterium]|nr:hypothetical protein [Chloroflexota bacterium]
MAKRTRCECFASRLVHITGNAISGIARTIGGLFNRRGVPIEVVITDNARRRTLTREISRKLRALQHILGTAIPDDVVVIVTHVIPRRRQPAGCFQVGFRPDGSRYAVIRLALTTNGHRLCIDEVLSTLAEQCLGILAEDAKSVVVPTEYHPDGGGPVDLPDDPLAPAA